MSKVVVTGGAGFIGSHLADQLVVDSHEVHIVDNLLLGKREFVNQRATFHEVDIRDTNALNEIFVGADVVFHLAADPRLQVSIENPQLTHDINVNGTLSVLLAAHNARVRKVIFSSSCTVYGDQEPPLVESFRAQPVSPYGLHKHIGEEYCRIFNTLFGIETVVLRYFNVFGPRKLPTGSYPMVIPIFLAQRQKNEPLTIVGDGEATRDYVHVQDVVHANIVAWHSAVSHGEPINIGSGRQISVNYIASLIGGQTQHIPPRLGEMRRVEAAISRAKELLNWSPSVSFEQGLELLKKEWGIQ